MSKVTSAVGLTIVSQGWAWIRNMQASALFGIVSRHLLNGQVCLPIQPEEVWDFDPEAVPTVQQLLREAKAARCSGAESSLTGPKKWDQTAMAPCMRFFQVHFLQPLLAAAQRQFNEKARHSATKPTLAW